MDAIRDFGGGKVEEGRGLSSRKDEVVYWVTCEFVIACKHKQR